MKLFSLHVLTTAVALAVLSPSVSAQSGGIPAALSGVQAAVSALTATVNQLLTSVNQLVTAHTTTPTLLTRISTPLVPANFLGSNPTVIECGAVNLGSTAIVVNFRFIRGNGELLLNSTNTLFPGSGGGVGQAVAGNLRCEFTSVDSLANVRASLTLLESGIPVIYVEAR